MKFAGMGGFIAQLAKQWVTPRLATELKNAFGSFLLFLNSVPLCLCGKSIAIFRIT